MSGETPATAPHALLGGTFDPVHLGHVALARDVARGLSLGRVTFVPAADPPHRSAPHASARHRLAMVRLAVQHEPLLDVDDRELRRNGPSYTVDTLAELKRERPLQPLALIVGADTFLGLPTWHRWRELFALAHVVVVARPGVEWREAMPPALAAEWQLRSRRGAHGLENPQGGSILEQPVVPHAVSASAIRERLAAGDMKAVRPWLAPPVLAYILDHHLYRSRTDVR